MAIGPSFQEGMCFSLHVWCVFSVYLMCWCTADEFTGVYNWRQRVSASHSAGSYAISLHWWYGCAPATDIWSLSICYKVMISLMPLILWPPSCNPVETSRELVRVDLRVRDFFMTTRSINLHLHLICFLIGWHKSRIDQNFIISHSS